MWRVHWLTRTLAILILFGFLFGYTFLVDDHFVVWSGGRQQDLLRSEHPTLFLMSALGFFLVGLLLLGGAFYFHLGLKLVRRPGGGPWGFSWFGLIMFSLGLIFAFAAFIAGAFHR